MLFTICFISCYLSIAVTMMCIQALLGLARRLPDGGLKIRTHIAHLERALEEACVTTFSQPTSSTQDDTKSSSVPPQLPASSNPATKTTAHSSTQCAAVMPTTNPRLPPHVLREMYASSAPDSRLYGGSMTAKRQQIVDTVTNEALEALHK